MSPDRIRPKDTDKNIIEWPSPELRHKTVATFPVPIVAAEIDLAVSIPLEANYLEACKTKGLIPHSHLKIALIGNRVNVSGETVAYGVTKEDAIQCMLPGKPSRIRMNVDQKGFNYFNSEIRPNLQIDGYDITQAELAVSTFHRRDNGPVMGGNFLETGVTIYPYQIRLQITQDCPADQKEKLTTWFNELQK